MVFKIVQTVEGGVTKLCVVPGAWEKNGKVYWPLKMSDTEFTKLKKDETSVPEKNWKTWDCKVKYIVNSHSEGKAKMAAMFSHSDTDNTEGVLPVLNRRKRSKLESAYSTPLKIKYGQVVLGIETSSSTQQEASKREGFSVYKASTLEKRQQHVPPILNFFDNRQQNYITPQKQILHQIPQEKQHHQVPTYISYVSPSQKSQQQHHQTQPFQLEQLQSTPVYFPEETSSQDYQHQNVNTDEEENENNPEKNTIVYVHDPQRCQCKNTANILENISKSQAEIQTKMSAFIKLVSKYVENLSINHQTPTTSSSKTILKRMTDIAEVECFESSLDDPTIMIQALKECEMLWGRKSIERYGTLVYCLLDKLFAKSFFAANFSWAGGSKGQRKVSFRTLININELFLRSIQNVDEEFNKCLCDNFFRNNVFKNALSRSKTQGLRTTKQRIQCKRNAIKKCNVNGDDDQQVFEEIVEIVLSDNNDN